MSFAEWAAAVGLLTPLILGCLAFLEKFLKKKEPEKKEPEVVQGMAVATNSYADQLIIELRADLAQAESKLAVYKAIEEERNKNGQ